MIITCSEKGAETRTYYDGKCEELSNSEYTEWYSCEDGVTITADIAYGTSSAHLIKAAVGSLVLGAISYMA